MELNTKNIVILGAVAVGGYLIYSKFIKKSTAASNEPNSPANKTAALKKSGYPAGLKEGDYIRVGDYAEVYLLKNGKKLPITLDWWNRYAGNNWDAVKTIAPIDGLDIPTGDVLSV
jgi:hypothetical protein